MKIYVAQYESSLSPMGRVVAVSAQLERAQTHCQSYEFALPHKSETLTWERETIGRWVACGFGGEYTIREWEVAP